MTQKYHIESYLKLENLTYQFESKQMCYDLNLNKGQTLALIGPSGGGKTTLLNLIAGFLTPQSGHLILDQQNIQNHAVEHRPINMLFQEYNLFPHLTVFENIAIGLRPNLKVQKNEAQKIQTLLDHIGLSELTDRLPAELSGGQRQRVALARAFLRQKPILLMDEPFSALDPGRKKSIIKLIKEIQSNQNLTIIYSTHDPYETINFADQCAFIDEGRIQAVGTPESLLNTQDAPSALKKYLG